MLISLPIEQEKDMNKRKREIIVPVSQIGIEDWFGADRTTVLPNLCRVSFNGATHKVLLSKSDLLKELEAIGVKVNVIKSKTA